MGRELRIAVAYNLRRSDAEAEAEHLSQDYVDGVVEGLRAIGHDARAVEVSGSHADVMKRLARAEADLVFNLAEGETGAWREAFYPILYEFLALPYTGAKPRVLALGLDKRLAEEALALRGVRVPKGRMVTADDPALDGDLEFPVLIKPNFGGSSMGIHQDSVVHDPQQARQRVGALLEEYPDGVDVEEFIEGREMTIGFVGTYPEGLTEIVEYEFPDNEQNIFDYETKQAGEAGVDTRCPADVDDETAKRIRDVAVRAFAALGLQDLGRVDLRLRDGDPVVIEINPLPGLRRISPLVVGAAAGGLGYEEILRRIVDSAARRHGLLMQEVQA